MFQWLTAAVVFTAAIAAGCATRTIAPPAFDDAAVLTAADAQLARGCLDCFVDAAAEYGRVQATRPSQAAVDGIVRASALIDLREQELGLAPSHTLDRVRAQVPLTSADTQSLIVVADGLLTRDARTIIREQNQWVVVLRDRAAADHVAGYLLLSLLCGPYGSSIPSRDDRSAVGDGAGVPLLAYKVAVSCNFRDRAALESVRAIEPRLNELDYWLGLTAISGQPQISGPAGLPDLETADQRFNAAYAWRTEWPVLTLAIANVALTAEDFERAFEFYDKTLSLQPDEADAFIGKIRALTYLERSSEAVLLATTLLALNRNPGEARYWRAYNELRLDALDEAWSDVESAAPVLINADVPKLAGLIAIRRREWGVARERLQLSLTRRSSDCEAMFYLQAVAAEQREWREAANTAARAATCLDAEYARLSDELTSRHAEPASPRRDRQIARREGELASVVRMRATAWFNGAAANYNLSNREEARRLAQKLEEDATFGPRARQLIEQIGR